MYYLLHHSKGALVISAEDRDQVVEWSKRQLGQQANTASVIESDLSELDGGVERSGTGVQTETTIGCRPMMSITADLTQGLSNRHVEKRIISGFIADRRNSAREPVWH